MLRNGAHGYLLRDSSATELILAIQTVQAGHYYLAKTLSQSTIETFINQHNSSSDLDAYTSLTNREREILNLILSGNTNAQIAEQLVLSPRTVETHRANMMRKINVHNQAELMQYALRRGLLSP
jgi:DNA-binding NarL/FixJ family response regulator